MTGLGNWDGNHPDGGPMAVPSGNPTGMAAPRAQAGVVGDISVPIAPNWNAATTIRTGPVVSGAGAGTGGDFIIGGSKAGTNWGLIALAGAGVIGAALWARR